MPDVEASTVDPKLRSSSGPIASDPRRTGDSGWRVVPPFLGAALLAALALAWIGNPLGRATTLGSIWVDSPEIYTRERLVNDRFIQDAWLNRQLEKKDIRDALQISEDNVSARVGTAASSVPGRTAAASQAEGSGTPVESSLDRLRAEVDFREFIRNMAVENQLDDRHDLHGHSLYRFKFDASILPGNNTQATALIQIRLVGSPAMPTELPPAAAASSAGRKGLPRAAMPPAEAAAPTASTSGDRALSVIGHSNDEIDKWRKVYARWLDNLRSRLNQTHKELRQGYAANEFAHNDYVRLIAFLERNVPAKASAPACPPTLAAIRGLDAEPALLRAEEHAQRKACVVKLVEKDPAVDPKAAESSVEPAGLRETAVRDGAAKQPSGLDEERPLSTAEGLEKWLNAFFASKSVQLVLGISVPEAAFVGQYDLYAGPSVEQLAKLSFLGFDSRINVGYVGNVFSVKQRIVTVYAIDPAKVAKEALAQFADEHNIDLPFDAFLTAPKVSARLLVASSGLEQLQDEEYPLRDGELAAVPGVDGLYAADAELGLFRFARKAGANTRAYTYSVTPKESGDLLHSSLGSDARVDAPGLGRNGAAIGLGRERVMRAVARRGTVVGFGTAGKDVADFGWLIGPRMPVHDGPDTPYVHGIAQYSLTALVSIPSWWSEVELQVSTKWIGLDGVAVGPATKELLYKVEIPTDFEPLETALLEVQQLGPELMDSRLDPVSLTACKPGAIVIPGRRLWRSTRVTLGYQSADEISVLPNMKGIVATFRQVLNQATVDEFERARRPGGPHAPFEIRRPVRVWTSQGTINLPTPARIGIPNGCDVGDDVRSAAK